MKEIVKHKIRNMPLIDTIAVSMAGVQGEEREGAKLLLRGKRYKNIK